MFSIENYSRESMIRDLENQIEERHQEALKAVRTLRAFLTGPADVVSMAAAPAPTETSRPKRRYTKRKAAQARPGTPKDPSGKTQMELVVDLMSNNPNTWFTSRDVADITGMSYQAAQQLLSTYRHKFDRRHGDSRLYEYRLKREEAQAEAAANSFGELDTSIA